MKRAAIYARASTPEQHVETQLYDLRQLTAQRGFEVVAEFTDNGVSGTKARRHGLDSLMADARKRKFSVVLVAAFDRVARSTKHFLQVMDEFDDLGIEFVSRRENVDTSGPMGRLFLTLIGSIAELVNCCSTRSGAILAFSSRKQSFATKPPGVCFVPSMGVW